MKYDRAVSVYINQHRQKWQVNVCDYVFSKTEFTLKLPWIYPEMQDWQMKAWIYGRSCLNSLPPYRSFLYVHYPEGPLWTKFNDACNQYQVTRKSIWDISLAACLWASSCDKLSGVLWSSNFRILIDYYDENVLYFDLLELFMGENIFLFGGWVGCSVGHKDAMKFVAKTATNLY